MSAFETKAGRARVSLAEDMPVFGNFTGGNALTERSREILQHYAEGIGASMLPETTKVSLVDEGATQSGSPDAFPSGTDPAAHEAASAELPPELPPSLEG